VLLYSCFTADSRFAASTQWLSLYFLLHAAESPLHAADNSLHAAESPLHAADNSLHAAESSLHAADDSLHAAESSLHAVDNSLHAVGSPLHAADNSLHAAESSLHAVDSSLHAAGSLRPAASSVTASCRGALLACHHNPPTVRYAIVMFSGYSIRCHPLLPLPSLLPYARKMRTPTATLTWQPPALPIYLLFYDIC